MKNTLGLVRAQKNAHDDMRSASLPQGHLRNSLSGHADKQASVKDQKRQLASLTSTKIQCIALYIAS